MLSAVVALLGVSCGVVGWLVFVVCCGMVGFCNFTLC